MEVLEEAEGRSGAPAWVVTFADLMSLLLAFFVLMLSFSNTEIVKFRTMAGSVRNALGMKSEFDLSDIPMGSKLLPYESPQKGDGEAREALATQLRMVLEEAGLKDRGAVEITERGVLLRLSGDLFFSSGEVELKPKALSILNLLAVKIKAIPRSIDVEGHTDDVPIATNVYPSNWELSAARAGRAVRHLVEQGIPADQMRAIGHADTVPLDDNSVEEGRAANRRVEFLFLAPKTEGRAEGKKPPSRNIGEYLGARGENQ